tara:strand:- start:127 stop:816 length:690 start_codon:yes stop_codon:yes gene_type:complete
MVYPKLKKTKVGYFYIPNDFMHPSLQQELQKINKNVYGCPSIGGLNNRLFTLPSILSVEIEFGINKEGPYYNYMLDEKVHSTSSDMHELMGNMLSVRASDDGRAVLQQTISMIFVTDDKDLEMTLMNPLDNVDKINCSAVIGSFYPYAWLRPINLSWVQDNINKPATINLVRDKPSNTIFFNKPINLNEIEPTEKILKFMSYTTASINFHRNIRTIFPTIKRKRPKRMI